MVFFTISHLLLNDFCSRLTITEMDQENMYKVELKNPPRRSSNLAQPEQPLDNRLELEEFHNYSTRGGLPYPGTQPHFSSQRGNFFLAYRAQEGLGYLFCFFLELN